MLKTKWLKSIIILMKLKIKHMKKLALLTIILFTTFSSFSQTVTKEQDTIPFPTKWLKPITKELISYDGLKLVDKQKDSIILNFGVEKTLWVKKDSLKDEKIGNLNLIINKKDQQISLYDNMAKDLQKELKVQQMKTKFYKAGSILGIGVAVITTTLYIIK